MRGPFAAESHGLYFRPEVHVTIEDGRSFVRRSTEKYQVLQATLVDTWASTAAGAFALSENNLYTADAFYDYLTHLTDDGVMTFTRWGFDPPRESLRLITLAMTALARVGETDPARHVMVVRDDTSKLYGWGAQDTVMISRKPFTDADVGRAKQLLSETKMEAVYLPGANGAPAIGSGNPFGELLTSTDPPAFWRSYRYDVSPVNDDRPFFFYTVQPRDLWNFVMNASTESADYKVNRAIPLLFALVAVSIGATLLILFLPRLVLGTRLPKQKGIFVFLMYFLCLGAGYILIQVALIQKFVLLLGHPTYALTVIVFSMLVASGAGSFWSRSVIADNDARLMQVLAGVAVLVAVLAFAAPADHVRRCIMAAPGENADHRAGHRPGSVPNGHAVPQRLAASGTTPLTVGTLGLVVKCGRQCVRLWRGDRTRDLHRPACDPLIRRRTLFGCVNCDPGYTKIQVPVGAFQPVNAGAATADGR